MVPALMLWSILVVPTALPQAAPSAVVAVTSVEWSAFDGAQDRVAPAEESGEWTALGIGAGDRVAEPAPTASDVQEGDVTPAISTGEGLTQPAVEKPVEAITASIDLLKVLKGEQKLTAEQLIQLGPWANALTTLTMAVLAFIPRLVVAVILLGVFWLIYRALRRMVVGSLRKAKVDSSICDMLQSMLKWAVLGFGLIVACNQIGIPILAMLTGVSIVGLAIGFAAQETLANFIAGVVIFLDRPFQVGHWVRVDGTFGQVQRVSFRSTRLLTGDGETVILPNTMMLNQKLINSTPHPVQRVRVPIGIAYRESIDDARALLLAMVVGDERISHEPAPVVVVTGCGASSVDLELRFWVDDESIQGGLVAEYLEKAKKTLDAAEIQIPYPHLQVLLEETPALKALGAGMHSTRQAA